MVGKAFAKINLYLDITGRLPDGYHELCTVMQRISLCDEVKVKKAEGITVRTDRSYVPSDGRNTAFKAAKAFFEAAGIEGGAEISVSKVIPVGAGLGGGSADAASVLLQLNDLYDSPLTEDKIMEAALSVGADVPFCIKGGIALCRGKGEKITPLQKLPECAFLVAKPRFSVKTPEAYAEYDKFKGTCPDVSGFLDALSSGDLKKICEAMGNALETPVSRLYPDIIEIKRKIYETGALGAMMTGSGSAVFGIYNNEKEANAAAQKLRPERLRLFTALPV